MKRRIITALLILAALGAAGAARADIYISEVMASNGFYENGEAWDWIELHNDGDRTVDISGWYLSDSKKDPLKWSFPEGAKIRAGGYMTVYCTGEERSSRGKGDTFYTDYAISSSGETLILSGSDGEELSRVKLPAQYGCVSWGLPSGGGEYGFFEHPTRGKKNDGTAYASRTPAPDFTNSPFPPTTVSTFTSPAAPILTGTPDATDNLPTSAAAGCSMPSHFAMR